MSPSLETMEAAAPKCPKVTTSWKLGERTDQLCGRPLKYDADRNVWMCPIPGHPDVKGEELAAVANETIRFDEEAPAA